jgi:hypothetical protein
MCCWHRVPVELRTNADEFDTKDDCCMGLYYNHDSDMMAHVNRPWQKQQDTENEMLILNNMGIQTVSRQLVLCGPGPHL